MSNKTIIYEKPWKLVISILISSASLSFLDLVNRTLDRFKRKMSRKHGNKTMTLIAKAIAIFQKQQNMNS